MPAVIISEPKTNFSAFVLPRSANLSFPLGTICTVSLLLVIDFALKKFATAQSTAQQMISLTESRVPGARC